MVFGGSGFIGSNVVDAFVKNGAKVSVFDLVRPQSEGVDFVEGNILDRVGLSDEVGYWCCSLSHWFISHGRGPRQ